jgi:hypothetical protein
LLDATGNCFNFIWILGNINNEDSTIKFFHISSFGLTIPFSHKTE